MQTAKLTVYDLEYKEFVCPRAESSMNLSTTISIVAPMKLGMFEHLSNENTTLIGIFSKTDHILQLLTPVIFALCW